MDHIQQSLNVGSFSVRVGEKNAESVKSKALDRLMRELEAGQNSGELLDEAEVYRILGITLR
jgi:DNA-damage-inducible protein J